MRKMSLMFSWKTFEELTNTQLYQLLKLRFDVFVIEQQCFYPELDNNDQQARHCLMKNDKGDLLGVGRLHCKTFQQQAVVALGRFAIAQQYRGLGAGKAIILAASKEATRCWPNLPQYLSAQAHLKPLYSQCGFFQVGQPYDDEGIEHIDMINKASKNQFASLL